MLRRVHLSKDLESRLGILLQKTGYSRKQFVHEAVATYIDELEDVCVSLEQFKDPAKLRRTDIREEEAEFA